MTKAFSTVDSLQYLEEMERLRQMRDKGIEDPNYVHEGIEFTAMIDGVMTILEIDLNTSNLDTLRSHEATRDEALKLAEEEYLRIRGEIEKAHAATIGIYVRAAELAKGKKPTVAKAVKATPATKAVKAAPVEPKREYNMRSPAEKERLAREFMALPRGDGAAWLRQRGIVLSTMYRFIKTYIPAEVKAKPAKAKAVKVAASPAKVAPAKAAKAVKAKTVEQDDTPQPIPADYEVTNYWKLSPGGKDVVKAWGRDNGIRPNKGGFYPKEYLRLALNEYRKAHPEAPGVPPALFQAA